MRNSEAWIFLVLDILYEANATLPFKEALLENSYIY